MANPLASPSSGRTLTALLLAGGLWLGGCSGERPDTLGVSAGRLHPCPESPNCVSSQAQDPEHQVAPLKVAGAHPIQQVQEVLNDIPRAQVVTLSEHYLHAEFTSRVFRFVDDVEFFWSASEQAVEVRSASRLGYSDLGVNRARVEELRARLEL